MYLSGKPGEYDVSCFRFRMMTVQGDLLCEGLDKSLLTDGLLRAAQRKAVENESIKAGHSRFLHVYPSILR